MTSAFAPTVVFMYIYLAILHFTLTNLGVGPDLGVVPSLFGSVETFLLFGFLATVATIIASAVLPGFGFASGFTFSNAVVGSLFLPPLIILVGLATNPEIPELVRIGIFFPVVLFFGIRAIEFVRR